MTPLDIALEALNRIASWTEGPTVDSTFDEPSAARVARRAIEDLKHYQPLDGQVLLDVARKGIKRHFTPGQPMGATGTYLAIGREFESFFGYKEKS